jgi:hypothetical protein
MFSRLRTFVLALSGAHAQTLDLVESERPRFESIGWMILVTSGIAAVSMWFALSTAIGINGILAIPPALLWGLVIMGIDRWLVTSMPADGRHKWFMAVPRFALALLLGTLISTPFVLRIFQSEINAQVAVIHQKSYSAFLQQQQSSQVAAQVTLYKGELQQLNTVITSHGAATGNTAADPLLVSYNKQLTTLNGELTHWTGLKAQYYREYICQLYGGPDCPKAGFGPAAKDSLQNYNAASQEVNTIKGRYAYALGQQPLVENEYKTAVQAQSQLQQAYLAQEQASHGILIRLEALSQLSTGNFTVTAARFLVFLLFLVIECLPVAVKLLQRPGLYEEAILYTQESERQEVRRVHGGSPGLRRRWIPASGAPSVIQGQVEQGPPPDVRAIWNPDQPDLPPTRVLPPPAADTESAHDTQVLGFQRHARPERSAGYPPAEADPSPAYGWGRSAAGDPRQADSAAPGPRPAQQRMDTQYPGEAAGDGWYQAQPGPGADGGYREEVWSEDDALAEMEDERASARPNGNGVPLSWDDD